MCRNTKNLPVHACGFCMFLFIFFNVFSAACFTCMAINLHLVYVHSTRHIKHLELYYLIGSFTISFILAIIPLFPKNTHYGYNLSMGVCWYNAPTQKGSLIWALTTIYLWVAIFIVYCCISISLVLVKIRKEEVTINASLALDNKRNYFSHLFFRPHQRLGTICEVQPAAPASLLQSQLSTKNDRKLESSYVLKTVSKVIWYPIILIITRIWGVANICIMATTTKVNPFFYIMSYIALPIQDPAFTAATRRVISSFRHKDEEEKAPIMETTLSRNTENLTNRTASLSRISRQRLSFAHLPTSIQLSAKVHPSQRHSPSTFWEF
ncbi:hypothetical protein CLU79DRAFT_888218 [Phycomyces nitens]|nr:hypothetical protein CLU79DRAFT_888218 [Phycomyces nitens]